MLVSQIKYREYDAGILLTKFMSQNCQKNLLHQSTGNNPVWRKSAFRIEIQERFFFMISTLFRAHFPSSLNQNPIAWRCMLLGFCNITNQDKKLMIQRYDSLVENMILVEKCSNKTDSSLTLLR